MCGIAGFLSVSPFACKTEGENILNNMNDSQMHRGPDTHGVWIDGNNQIGLGHTRLSILDTSERGSQPMHYENLSIVYNGEIYNHLTLRDKLNADVNPDKKAISWYGMSDTETLIKAIYQWGIEKTIKFAEGMFAFAVYNRDTSELYLVRDRFGEKPLFYWYSNQQLVFSSELSAISQYPRFNKTIDEKSVGSFLRFSYVPGPYTIFKDVFKVSSATIESFKINHQTKQVVQLSTVTYWQFDSTMEQKNEELTLKELEQTLKNVIKKQMLSDVPLGAFLSGGVDSSLVVAMMKRVSSQPVSTFTVGFNDNSLDESKAAKAIAKHLQTEHYELMLTNAQVATMVPDIIKMWDEPFADASQIPTYLLSKFAKQWVTVVLTGDGGDEMFGGYNRYKWIDSLWNVKSTLPRVAQVLLQKAIGMLSPKAWNSFYSIISPIIPAKHSAKQFGTKLYKFKQALSATSIEQFYLLSVSNYNDLTQVMVKPCEHKVLQNEPETWPKESNFTQKMMQVDMASYMRDGVLVKVDRATMRNHLESRAPFLDKEIAELSAKMHIDLKIKEGETKKIVKSLLKRYVPSQLTDHPKQGFTVPLAEWLRGPLLGWAQQLIDDLCTTNSHLFNQGYVKDMWTRHLSGAEDLEQKLWPLLTFQSWYNNCYQIDKDKINALHKTL